MGLGTWFSHSGVRTVRWTAARPISGGVQYQLRALSECQICTSCCSDVVFDLCLSVCFAERFVAGGRSQADGLPGWHIWVIEGSWPGLRAKNIRLSGVMEQLSGRERRMWDIADASGTQGGTGVLIHWPVSTRPLKTLLFIAHLTVNNQKYHCSTVTTQCNKQDDYMLWFTLLLSSTVPQVFLMARPLQFQLVEMTWFWMIWTVAYDTNTHINWFKKYVGLYKEQYGFNIMREINNSFILIYNCIDSVHYNALFGHILQ